MSLPPRIVFSTSTSDDSIDDEHSLGDTASQTNIIPGGNSHSSFKSNPNPKSKSDSISEHTESRRRLSSIGNDAIINNRLSIFTDTSINLFNNTVDDNQSIDSQSNRDINDSFMLNNDNNDDPFDILDSALKGGWMPNADIIERTESSDLHHMQPNHLRTFGNDLDSNDLELNHWNASTNDIPQKHLDVPDIQIDNYMELSPQTRNTSNFQQSPDPKITFNVPSNYISANTSLDALDTISASNDSSTSVKHKFLEFLTKLSNIINADSPLDYSKETDDLKLVDLGEPSKQESDDVDGEEASFTSRNANPFMDELYSNATYNSDENVEESVLKFYLDEIDYRHQHQHQNDDIVSILTPRISISHLDTNNTSIPIIETTIETTQEENNLFLFGNTLKYFSPKSKMRINSAKIITHPTTSIVLTSFLVLQVIIISIEQWKVNNGYFAHGGYTITDFIVFFFYICYTTEMILKIIAYGLYDDFQMMKALKLQRYENKLSLYYKRIYKKVKNSKLFEQIRNQFYEREVIAEEKDQYSDTYRFSHISMKNIRYAYLRTGWNRIDFVSIISFWVTLVVANNIDAMRKAQVFRSLMCLRILRLLNITRGSRVILRGLRDAAKQSKNVILFLLFFWVIFAIIGIVSFRTSFRRQCLWTNPDDVNDTFLHEFQFCGSYLDPQTLKILPYLTSHNESSGTTKGFACPVNSICRVGENPYGGRVSFDNIFTSMQSVFVIVSANTFTDLMYYTMDSESMAASLFFIIGMFVLVVWLLNLLIAVVIHSYRTEDEASDSISWFDQRHQYYLQLAKSSKSIQTLKKFEVIPVLIILLGFLYSCKTSLHTHHFRKKYNTGDFIVSTILLFEILLRFLVYIYSGFWRGFFFSKRNLLDLSLAIPAFAFSLPPFYDSVSPTVYGWLTVFSIMRLYRVGLFVKPLRDAWILAFKKAKQFFQLILFAIMFTYFCAIIITRLFEDVIPTDDNNETLWIMNNLPNTIVTLFIITSTENWTSSLYTAQQHAISSFNSFCYSVFLILWYLMSNTILLSIFIAMITSGLKLPEAEKKINQIRQFIKICISRVQSHPDEGIFDIVKANKRHRVVLDEANEFIKRMNEILVDSGHEPINIEEYKDADSNSFRQKINLIKRKLIEVTYYQDFILLLQKTKDTVNYVLSKINPFKTKHKERTVHPNKPNIIKHGKLKSTNLRKKESKVDRSLLIFTNESPIRRFCQMLISPIGPPRTEGKSPNANFVFTFNVFLFLSSVVVVVFACYETPLYKIRILKNNSSYWILYPEIVFLVIFTIEFFMKIIADGFICGPRAYAKSAWNLIDFVVLVSFWDTVMSVIRHSYGSAAAFGAVKALRAFRLLSIIRESKEVFQITVLSGSSKIISAALVSLSLLIPFALWGLNIFGNELSQCSDGVSSIFNCSLEYTNEVFKWEIYSPNYVKSPPLNFSKFSSSLLTLFEILSLEGWTDLLDNIISITSYGEPSKPFASPGNGVFVILFIFVSMTLITNLFIAIIINNYSVKTGTAFLNNDQYGWYEVKKVLSKVRPSKRRIDFNMSRFKSNIYYFITQKNGVWQWSYRTILAVHFMTLITEFYPSSPSQELVRTIIQTIDTFGLCFPFILYPIAFGFRQFYSKAFNIIMSLVSATSFILTVISLKVNYTSVVYDVYKVFLVMELMLIIPQSDSLTQLFKYGSTSLFSLITILYTWLVLFLVYAIAMNQVFGLTRLGSDLSGNLNARTVTKALIMLFRNSFGEAWNYSMNDFEIKPPYCYDGGYGNNDCGNKTGAMILFISWNILSMYVFCNILISVVINNFSYVYHGSGPHKLITREETRKFKTAWNKFDITGTGYIYEKDLFEFLHSLDGILSYHVYPKYMTLSVLREKLLVDPENAEGYDFLVNLTKLEEALSLIDFSYIRRRRFRYNRLISEIIDAATVIKVDNFDSKSSQIIRKIPFSNTLLCIGFYSRFEDSTCLNLEDFLRHSSQIRLIDKQNRQLKFIATLKAVATRLKYLKGKNENIFQRIKDAPTEVEKENLKKQFREFLVREENDHEDSIKKLDELFETTTVFDQELFKVTSASSFNPFSDTYATMKDRDPIGDESQMQ